MRNLITSLLAIIVLSGCMVGPNYQRPVVETPDAWRFEEKSAKDVVNTAWWEQFNDPVLNELIIAALKENKDLMIAAARVEQYAGQFVSTRGALFPQIRASASAERQRFTERGYSPAPLGSPTVNTFEGLLNASWEIDLWGKLRRSTEAARADMLGVEEARQGVILTLVTSVASAYVNLRDLDKQLEITKSTAKTYGDSYDLFKLRFEGGVISEVELSQVKSQYEDALATIPQIEKSVAQQENALSLLLGKNPGSILRGKGIDDLTLPKVPAGLPSELLAQRPDIRQAEQQLISANAQIGVARAAYFPSISLTGFLGYASSDLSKLFTGPAKTWSWTAPVLMPIFTGGTIEGQVQTAEALQQQSLIAYQKAIQSAFRDVEDSLIDQSKTRERLAAQTRQVDALRNYARLARLRYDNGYTSYLEVLDAERTLFSVELSYTQTQGSLSQALINLYKAMGGGWITEAQKLSLGAPEKREP